MTPVPIEPTSFKDSQLYESTPYLDAHGQPPDYNYCTPEILRGKRYAAPLICVYLCSSAVGLSAVRPDF